MEVNQALNRSLDQLTSKHRDDSFIFMASILIENCKRFTLDNYNTVVTYDATVVFVNFHCSNFITGTGKLFFTYNSTFNLFILFKIEFR